ncbi:MAG: hypothetical protein FWF02_11220 [Micrococcales bacterium]|nr:hypothetical protein [Micrococcales bacterium]MCL2668258.1 hypothetical protein [Micrococcales bacterium]
MRRSALAVAPLLALVLVAGCGQGNNPRVDFDKKGADFGDSGTADTNDTANSGRNDPLGSLDSCVVGSWLADMANLMEVGVDPMDIAELRALGASFDLVFTFKKNGDYAMEMIITGSGTEQGVAYTLDGTISFTGSWSMSGTEVIDITTTDVGGQMTMVVGDQTQTIPVTDSDFTASDYSFGKVPATCSASTLEMQSGKSTLVLTRK